MKMPPLLPSRPRITSGGDCWILDTGHADVLHDTWQDALAHAERICRDYRARLREWSRPRCDAICDAADGGSCFTPWCRCSCHRSTDSGKA